MVPSRQTVPSTIRTKGPARERRGRGGRGGTGENPGVVTGLDIFHLARRGWLRALHCRRRRDIGWKARCSRRQGSEVSVRRSIALDQLDHSDHQQNGGPGSAKVHSRNVAEQEKHAYRHEHRRPHQLPGAAALALAYDRVATDQAPVLGKEPDAEKDQDERPETIQTELKKSSSVEQKKNAQTDENGGSDGNFGPFESLDGAKGLRPAEWVRSRFAHLDGLRAANRIDDLVDVEKTDGDA